MKTIKFAGDHEITYADLAVAIRRNGKLGTDMLYDPDTGLHCALGIAKAELNLPMVWSVDPVSLAQTYRIIDTNDDFEGSPEERANYMADLLGREII